MDIQKLFDAMSNVSRLTRSGYHLTLGEAIELLKALDPEAPIRTEDGLGVGNVCSYRGYYSDLGFKPVPRKTSVIEVLSDLEAALDQTFEGYKGGDFRIGPETPLWLSPYGDASGDAVMGIVLEDGATKLLIRRTK
jgi:hypothetical protein